MRKPLGDASRRNDQPVDNFLEASQVSHERFHLK
jgi:hypothetical protein